jgi:hypothetical protein
VGDEGAERRILDRLRRGDLQFVLPGKRDLQGAVGPIPLRERAMLNVERCGLCRIVCRNSNLVARLDSRGLLDAVF